MSNPTCPRCGADRAPKIYENGCDVCLGFIVETSKSEGKSND